MCICFNFAIIIHRLMVYLDIYRHDRECEHTQHFKCLWKWQWQRMAMKINLLPWYTTSVILIKYIWIIQDTDNFNTYISIQYIWIIQDTNNYIHIHVNIYAWQTGREALAYVPKYLLCNICYLKGVILKQYTDIFLLSDHKKMEKV